MQRFASPDRASDSAATSKYLQSEHRRLVMAKQELQRSIGALCQLHDRQTASPFKSPLPALQLPSMIYSSSCNMLSRGLLLKALSQSVNAAHIAWVLVCGMSTASMSRLGKHATAALAVQGAERRVAALMERLHRMKASGAHLSDSLPEVIEIVSDINTERGTKMEGRHSYVSASYVSADFCQPVDVSALLIAPWSSWHVCCFSRGKGQDSTQSLMKSNA